MVTNKLNEQIAQMCHEANKVICEMMGDYSQVHWEEVSEDIKQSAIDGVEYYLKHKCTAQEQHARWKEKKISQGYKYGPVKDDNAKTHPSIVPYSELPASQKVKDIIFQNTIDNVVKVMDMVL